MSSIKDERLHLRVNGEVKKKVQQYCEKYSMDMSDLVTRFFLKIIAKEEERAKKK